MDEDDVAQAAALDTGAGDRGPRSGPRYPRAYCLVVQVTVNACVEMGAAPCPGNADPTPLNITSVTVYRPGRLYLCVGA